MTLRSSQPLGRRDFGVTGVSSASVMMPELGALNRWMVTMIGPEPQHDEPGELGEETETDEPEEDGPGEDLEPEGT